MNEFDLSGRTVRVPVPEGWHAEAGDGRVRVRREGVEEFPRPMVDVVIRPAEDPRDALEEELAGCARILTDFTVLHLEPRATPDGNWPDGAPAMPFVLAGCRQGVFSLVVELGAVGAAGAEAALAYTSAIVEEAASAQEDFDAILAGIEIAW